jgi:uncharacterized protein YggE
MRNYPWHRRLLGFVAATAATGWLLCCAADAQSLPAVPPPLGPPTLHLSAAGRIRVAPDELVADMLAADTSPSAVTAQRHVNTLMAQAAGALRQVPGIHAAFQDYSVSLSDEKHQRWTAQQTLELRGGESDALLDLVARLQGLGLAIGNLGWQVSEAKQQEAHDAAIAAALAELRHRAALAAKALGMDIDRFQAVRLDQGPPPGPIFHRMMAPAMAGAAMPAPTATPAPQEIGAEVSADVLLRASRSEGAPK